MLRTFALALREAEKWDDSPLGRAGVFCSTRPGKDGLSEAMRELVTVADTEEHEGRKTGVDADPGGRADPSTGHSEGIGRALKLREIEQAVVATFLHSQPIGQSARTRDLTVLIGATRPDKIELEKGLLRWSQVSHLARRPVHAPKASSCRAPGAWEPPEPEPDARRGSARASPTMWSAPGFIDEIGKVKKLTAGASAAGVQVHTLAGQAKRREGRRRTSAMRSSGPAPPADSGKPSAEASGSWMRTPARTTRGCIATPSLLLARPRTVWRSLEARVRDYLAWETGARRPQEAGRRRKRRCRPHADAGHEHR